MGSPPHWLRDKGAAKWVSSSSPSLLLRASGWQHLSKVKGAPPGEILWGCKGLCSPLPSVWDPWGFSSPLPNLFPFCISKLGGKEEAKAANDFLTLCCH